MLEAAIGGDQIPRTGRLVITFRVWLLQNCWNKVSWTLATLTSLCTSEETGLDMKVCGCSHARYMDEEAI
jgi:hypothetical protein